MHACNVDAGTETQHFNAVLEVANIRYRGKYICSICVSQKAQTAPKDITHKSRFHIKRCDKSHTAGHTVKWLFMSPLCISVTCFLKCLKNYFLQKRLSNFPSCKGLGYFLKTKTWTDHIIGSGLSLLPWWFLAHSGLKHTHIRNVGFFREILTQDSSVLDDFC